MERLQKVIANSGYTSRRKAEELILEGRVKVNGKTVYELGIKVDNNDLIQIDGEMLSKDEKVYYILNKPRGIITSTTDDKNRKTVVDIINTDKRIYPVGRLDYDTTGLLLLTNDGELANKIMHPKNKIDKVYIAKVKGFFPKEKCLEMARGVYIDGRKTSKCFVKLKNYTKKTDSSIVEVIIHEGRNHQVKKMFEAVGYNVLKLKRESVGFLTLDGLNSGEYRKLNPKEVKILYNEINK